MHSYHNEIFLYYNRVIAVVTNTMGSLKKKHLSTVIKLHIFKEEIWRIYKWKGACRDRTANRCQMGLRMKLEKQAGDFMVLAPSYPVEAET